MASLLENSECQECGEPKGTPYLHSCPYAEEINNDYEKKCNCCKGCSNRCAMDI